MKRTKRLVIVVALGLFIAGCVAPNPNYQPPPAAQGPDNPAFVPDPKLDQLTAAARGVQEATKSINPYSPITTPVVEGILGIVAAISAWRAKQKNDQIKTLAQGIVKAGPTAVATVHEVAASTAHYKDVAHVINEATP